MHCGDHPASGHVWGLSCVSGFSHRESRRTSIPGGAVGVILKDRQRAPNIRPRIDTTTGTSAEDVGVSVLSNSKAEITDPLDVEVPALDTSAVSTESLALGAGADAWSPVQNKVQLTQNTPVETNYLSGTSEISVMPETKVEAGFLSGH